jgi:Tfp pilus assembly protein FimT
MKTEDKTTTIIQLLLAIAIVATISIIGPPALHDLNESLKQQVQQACIVNLLQAEMLNTSSNNIINSLGCQSLFTNNTTNNG